MPELSKISARVCKSVISWERELVSKSSGKTYTISYGDAQPPSRKYTHEYSCSCPAFIYRGECKHIAEAKDFRCGWGSEALAGSPCEPNEDGTCPNCGGETVVVQIAV